MTSSSRAERRKAARDEARRRAEEIDRVLQEPKLPAFEAPPAGKIVTPATPTPPRTEPPRREPWEEDE